MGEHPKRVAIAGFVDGETAIISGRADAVETLESPFGRRVCVHYLATIEVEVRSGRWMPVAAERRSVDFSITDDTGSAQIVASDTRFAVRARTILVLERLHALPKRGRALIAADDVHPDDFRGEVRIQEAVAAAGQQLWVRGRGRLELDDRRSSSYRAVPQRLMIEGPVFVSDDEAKLKL